MGEAAIRQSGEAGGRTLGADLRALRKSRGRTLSELALMVGRSVGFLSQVERGLSSPSIADLRAIARALDVPMSLMFGDDDAPAAERGHIVRAGSRRQLGTRETGIVEELLSPDLGGSFEMFRSVFEPGAELPGAVLRDTEEAGFVAAGSLSMEIDGVWHDLNTGDSFRFDRKPYRWKNTGDVPAVVIWVVSPPVY